MKVLRGAMAALLVCLAASAFAVEPQDLARKTIDDVIAVLKNPELKGDDNKAKRHDAIQKILVDVFDTERVSMLTLAKHAEKFKPEEFKEFNTLFSELLFETYISHMDKYLNEKVEIGKVDKVSDDKVTVKTTIVSDTKKIPADYSMYKAAGKDWKVYDVHVEGVSIIKNYRSQFKEILDKDPPKKLIEQLKKKVND